MADQDKINKHLNENTLDEQANMTKAEEAHDKAREAFFDTESALAVASLRLRQAEDRAYKDWESRH